MAAVIAGLDWESRSTAPSSTRPGLLLQLCCLQYISCCSTAGGCSMLLGYVYVCVDVCVCVIVTFLSSIQMTVAVSSRLILWAVTVFGERAVTFVNTHLHTQLQTEFASTLIYCHIQIGNLHVIICILYKASMLDRPPTVQLVQCLADTQLTWCITVGPVSSLETDWQPRSPSDIEIQGGRQRERWISSEAVAR